MHRAVPALIVIEFAACALRAQSGLDAGDYLEALARTAATFAATAPGVVALETFNQRGRRGFVEVLKGRKDAIRDLEVKLPRDFHVHQIVSEYGLAEWNETHILHETRTLISLDGQNINGRAAGSARHALTIGLHSADDQIKRGLLEDLAQERLEGAVTDFGQLILLFTARLQHNYVFTRSADQTIGEEPAVALHYRQVSGSYGLTFFEDRSGERQRATGDIWFRIRDLLPIRITLNTHALVSKKFTIRTEATVDYMPSPFGLVPESVIHRQFLNSDLMVENDLHYAGFHRANAMIP